MKKFTPFFLGLLCIAFISCNSGSNEIGTVIDAKQFEELHSNKENDGKRLSVIGYPNIGTDLTIGRDGRGHFTLFSEPDAKGNVIGLIRVEMGTDKNEMYVPDNFTMEDLVIHDNEGNELTYQDKIQVSFTVDLDTNRDPFETSKLVKDETGKLVSKKMMKYYGQGPVNIRIDKATE